MRLRMWQTNVTDALLVVSVALLGSSDGAWERGGIYAVLTAVMVAHWRTAALLGAILEQANDKRGPLR